MTRDGLDLFLCYGILSTGRDRPEDGARALLAELDAKIEGMKAAATR